MVTRVVFVARRGYGMDDIYTFLNRRAAEYAKVLLMSVGAALAANNPSDRDEFAAKADCYE